MALKGTATIELTNADGTKEVIKHDNMITDAVADLCFSERGDMASILKMMNNNEIYAQTMFGGILLFDEVLNNDKSDYQLPSTKITGYASQDAYAGLDLARGSFNQSEGGVQPDGSYKFVWDFATSQGNGRIQSIALCPNVMGRIGVSDTIVSSGRSDFYIGRDPSAPFNTSGYMLDSNGSTNGISNYNYTIIATVGDIAYAADYRQIVYRSGTGSIALTGNGGILKLYRFKLGASSISLADRAGMARYIDSVDVTMPSAFVNQLSTRSDGYAQIGFSFSHADKILYVFPITSTENVGVNGTIYYVSIDFGNNMNTTLHSFTNTTPGTIYIGYNYYSGRFPIYVFKDHIIVYSSVNSQYRMYIINRTDNTKVKEVTAAGNTFVTNYYYFIPILSTNGVFVVGVAYNNNADYDTCIVDLNTGVLKGTNARNMNVKGGNIEIGNDTVRVSTGNYLTYYITINPFILTTKNNLDAPVTKTASQTMKITYTLSEVAG